MRLIIRAALILVGLLFTYNIGRVVFSFKTGYSIDFSDYERCKWVISPQFQDSIDPILCVSKYRDTDVYTSMVVGKYLVSVHEFYGLAPIELNNIQMDNDYYLDMNDLSPGQILNKKLNTLPTITAYWNLSWNDNLRLSFANDSKLDTISVGDNHLAFNMSSDRILFQNAERPLLLYDFKSDHHPFTFALVKRAFGFYVILIQVEGESTNESDLNLLNLALIN